jgi:NADH:ubiquinone oxidoreductase subunit H
MIKAFIAIVTVIACAAVLFAAGWIIPWTINVFGATLWPTHVIPYTWETAVAGAVILVVFTPRVTVKKKD